ncbi:MAG: hypothetical protein QMC48_03480, partial [SAR324 cluster bacterium]
MKKGTEALRKKKGTEGLKNKVDKFEMLAPGSASGDTFSVFSRATPNSVLENYFLTASQLKLSFSALLSVIVFLIGLVNPVAIMAQAASEDSGLEEALSGFDDEAFADDDDALSGFDDDSEENITEKETASATEEESWKQALLNFSGSAGISTGSTTNTKIILDTEEFDTNNCFDSTTNYRFTPTVAGYYQINGAVTLAVPATTGGAAARLYKNGTLLCIG